MSQQIYKYNAILCYDSRTCASHIPLTQEKHLESVLKKNDIQIYKIKQMLN